jgi:hypothetical protein
MDSSPSLTIYPLPQLSPVASTPTLTCRLYPPPYTHTHTNTYIYIYTHTYTQADKCLELVFEIAQKALLLLLYVHRIPGTYMCVYIHIYTIISTTTTISTTTILLLYVHRIPGTFLCVFMYIHLPIYLYVNLT